MGSTQRQREVNPRNRNRDKGRGRGREWCPGVAAGGAGVLPQKRCDWTGRRQKLADYVTRVMCDFMPRRPNDLPTSQWATLEQLLNQLEPYAPGVVARLGPQSLRQLIIEWYKDHPAFVGLPSSEWAKEVQGELQDALIFKVRSPCGPRRTALRYPRITFAPSLCSAAVLLPTRSRRVPSTGGPPVPVPPG